MCIINDETDAYLAYGKRATLQIYVLPMLIKILGAFAGCVFNGSLLTAALYRKDEDSQLGRPQEPIEGPCNKWARENSSKELLKAKRRQEETYQAEKKNDGDTPPQYHIPPKDADRPRGRQSKAPNPRCKFTTDATNYASF